MSFTTFAFLMSTLNLAACNQPSNASSKSTPAVSSKPIQVALNPVVDKEQCKAEIKATGSYTKDQEASFEVLVTTKTTYHINDQYPHSFKPSPTDGIAYPKEKIHISADKDAFKFEECASSKDKCTMRITVKFTPRKEGNQAIGGELKAGICNADRCLIEAVSLGTTIQVQAHKP